MKAMEFLSLLGELDEGMLNEAPPVPVVKRKKRRALWGAIAACICVCLLGFSAWFFVPPMTVTPNDLRLVVIRIDDRLVSYEILKTNTMSRFERMLLPDEPGEVLCTHGGNTFYRPKGADDLAYVIQERSDGSYAVLKFSDYVSVTGIDMTDSLLTENGWFTDMDIAALNGITKPTMGEILETVYNVATPEDIQSIRFEKDHAYEGGVEGKVRIKAVTVKDSEALARLYNLLAPMIPSDYAQKLDFGHVDARDEAYLRGEAPLSAQVNRDLTLTLVSGRRVTLSYYPATGLLYQHGTGLYSALSEADNKWLMDLAEIDMDWKDWGTEKELGYGEGCESATNPIPPETEAP